MKTTNKKQFAYRFGAVLLLTTALSGCGQKGGDGGLVQTQPVPKNFVPGVRVGRSMMHTVLRAGGQNFGSTQIRAFLDGFEGLMPTTGGGAVITDHVKIALDFCVRVGRNAADNAQGSFAKVFPGVNVNAAPLADPLDPTSLNLSDEVLQRVTYNIYTRTHGLTPTPELQTMMVDASKEFLVAVAASRNDSEGTRRALASIFAMIAIPMIVN